MEMCGVPPPRILESATRVKMFFDSNGSPRLVPNSRGKTRRPGSKDLQMVLRSSESKYVDFLTACLQWEPRERFTPEDALQHEWILQGYTKHVAQPDPQSHRESQQSPPASSSKRRAEREGRQHRAAPVPAASGSSFVFPPIDAASGGLAPTVSGFP